MVLALWDSRGKCDNWQLIEDLGLADKASRLRHQDKHKIGVKGKPLSLRYVQNGM
jgi:hypothetical protein